MGLSNEGWLTFSANHGVKTRDPLGFGMIEMVVVTAVVIATLFAFLQSGILSVRLLRNEKENLEATLLAQEALEAIRSVRDESWVNNITPLVNGIFYYPVVFGSKWQLTTISPGPINGKYTRYVVFDQVLRDAEDRIATTGTLDTGTRKVTATVFWGIGKQIEFAMYITNFQSALGQPQEVKAIFFEDAPTDADLANFPSNSSGDGDPAESFTTLSDAIQVTKVELYLKRITASPSNIYAELRVGPTGTVLGTSNLINSSTISDSSLGWVEFRFSNPVSLNALTAYNIRLRSVPFSTDASSGSSGIIHWGYGQTPTSPYAAGEARRYIGRLSNPSDTGQLLDQYDFGFRVYDLQ